MFCIQLEDEGGGISYLSEDGKPTKDFKEIKWWPYYLACEEQRGRHGGKVVVSSKVVIERICVMISFLQMELRKKDTEIEDLKIMATHRESRIHQLLQETIEQQKRLNPELEDYQAANFTHLISMEGKQDD